MLGLRALYFVLADMAGRFHLLSYGLAVILMFIGVKMLLIDFYKIPVFLALGAWRLSRQQVLTRRLPAIETLGAATVLCTDKTGTLTLNRMAVAELCVAGQTWRVADAGEAAAQGAPSLPEAFHALLEFGVLASQTEPLDPMEQALWRLALNGNTVLSRTEMFKDRGERIRDVRQAADGALMLLTDSGKLMRLAR